MKFKKYDTYKNWNAEKGYKGRKNNFKFDVKWDFNKKIYWVMVEDCITEIAFNSLWRNVTFKISETKKAFKFCEQLAVYYKQQRITQISDCTSRVDEFLCIYDYKED